MTVSEMPDMPEFTGRDKEKTPAGIQVRGDEER